MILCPQDRVLFIQKQRYFIYFSMSEGRAFGTNTHRFVDFGEGTVDGLCLCCSDESRSKAITEKKKYRIVADFMRKKKV